MMKINLKLNLVNDLNYIRDDMNEKLVNVIFNTHDIADVQKKVLSILDIFDTAMSDVIDDYKRGNYEKYK